jgi:ATP/maltotriose-dependent transcriptional regulator MalT
MGPVGVPKMLVAGKLRVPPVPARLVERPRVEGLIAAMVERHPAVFVVATTGAGKTTALVRAARLVDRPLAWLTVSDGDVAAGRLLEYLDAAISRHVPSAAGLARAALAAGVSQDEVAGLLAEAVGAWRLLLVVDEAERLADAPGSVAVIDSLLRYGGEQLGAVGGRIVGDVLIGIISSDPEAYLAVDPNWTPTLPRHDSSFRLRDLLVPA